MEQLTISIVHWLIIERRRWTGIGSNIAVGSDAPKANDCIRASAFWTKSHRLIAQPISYLHILYYISHTPVHQYTQAESYVQHIASAFLSRDNAFRLSSVPLHQSNH